MGDDYYIRTQDLCRHYERGHHNVRALDGVTLSVKKGEFFGIVGASGSGKSTMLNLLAGLDTPTSGSIEVKGVNFSAMSRKDLARYRAHSMGMIFQSFNLISHQTALQNVESALYFNGTPPRERRVLAEKIMAELGLADRLTHKPADLSGGEQQRVAVARAIVKNPEILFADEPTGNLDFDNSELIASLLKRLNANGLTIVMVTHNLEFAGTYADRVIRMKYGRIDTTPRTEGASPL